MSWYNGSFKRRQSIAIDGSSDTAGTYDLVISIPVDLDSFWDNIRSDGNDVVVTLADGTSITNFQFRSGFNISNRNVTLQVQNYALALSAATGHVFLYWDNPDQSTSLQTAHSPAVSTLNGYIFQCLPAGRVVRNIGITPTGTQPQTIFSKEPNEKVDVFFPVNAILAKRAQAYNQHLQCNEVSYVLLDVQNSSGASQASMKADEEIRFIGGWCRVRIQAGTTATDYVIKLLVHTTDAQSIFLNAILEVNALLPT